MPLPTNVQEFIDEALDFVERHPGGKLTLGRRQQIWNSLGPRVMIGNRADVGNVGLRRRARLAISVAKKVLPRWQELWADYEWDEDLEDEDGLPLNRYFPQRIPQLLESAEQYLEGGVEFETLREQVDRVHYELDCIFCEVDEILGEDAQAVKLDAGRAARRAAFTALYDEFFDPDAIAVCLEHSDIDQDLWDSTVFASELIGEVALDGDADKEVAKRREFWQWYLREAVPNAWDSES